MRRSPGDAVKEFEELRRLLLSQERREIDDLRDQLTNKERRSQDVAAILPEAVKMSRARGDELAGALRPAVETSVRESIEKRPETFVNALHPIIGPIVRRSLAESMRRLLQSLNQSLEHTFSWRGLKWRFEALRTGKSFAEVVMLRSLVYRVEQVFLIHRETSLALLHVSADPGLSRDSDMVAGMLSAIQDFARDSFHTGDDSSLDEFRMGQLQVWIASGPSAYLAAVIRGNPSRELRNTLEETIDSIHTLKGSALANFGGDPAVFESLRPELEACLRAQYADKKGSRRPIRAWFIIVAAAAVVAAGVIALAQSGARWNRFVRQLESHPGIVVTDAQHHWFGKSEVSGLRDAAATDPASVARAAGLDPAGIKFDWKEYLALDDASVQRRFERRFGVPPGAVIHLQNGVLALSGNPPYEWLDRVRHEATLVPGVNSIADQAAKVSFDRNLAQERFETRFGQPDGIYAHVENGVLALNGEASHRWLTRVRAEATKLPGISSVDSGSVVDLDERAFAQSKSIIESAFVYFLTNKDNIATEGFTALSRLPDELRRCDTAGRRTGREISLEIDGHADVVGSEAKNADLSLRRAEKVSEFLVSCGFDPGMLHSKGVTQPAPASGDKPLPEESDRRVGFKVVSRPIVAKP
ncbi:MAG: OmpA family protein [Chthoniobacterales bacterium]|nr:OmpA family protein [Chthoniobacterales bacterium]